MRTRGRLGGGLMHTLANYIYLGITKNRDKLRYLYLVYLYVLIRTNTSDLHPVSFINFLSFVNYICSDVNK